MNRFELLWELKCNLTFSSQGIECLPDFVLPTRTVFNEVDISELLGGRVLIAEQQFIRFSHCFAQSKNILKAFVLSTIFQYFRNQLLFCAEPAISIGTRQVVVAAS